MNRELGEVEKYIEYHSLASRAIFGLEKIKTGELSDKIWGELEAFFKRCEEGRKATMKELITSPEKRKGSWEYNEVFRKIQSASIPDYRSALTDAKKGDERSIEMLREFFGEMLAYSSEMWTRFNSGESLPNHYGPNSFIQTRARVT